MELAELVAYAEEKYNMKEEFRWADFPGFSALCDSHSGKWLALLMRQWDGESGMQIERCDLKCGRQCLTEFRKPYLLNPVRMKGANWIGVIFDDRTEPEVVFELFDRAVRLDAGRGYTIVLDDLSSHEGERARDTALPQNRSEKGNQNTVLLQDRSGGGSASLHNQDGTGGFRELEIPQIRRGLAGISPQMRTEYSGYQDTPLPSVRSTRQSALDPALERLHEMRSLFVYGRESIESKAKNFVRQAVFMEDFEDDFPWKGDFLCFFPTYQDMTLKQLRGYFTWRTHVRKGEFLSIPSSAAYLYIYELLNGIGADSPEEALKKMEEFEAGYLDSGIGDNRMRKNLRRWMLEYAVLEGVSPEIARRFADSDMLERDSALAVLQNPDSHSDEELFAALCFFCGKKLAESPVITKESSRGKHLFCEVWRSAASIYEENEKYLFTLCFGEQIARPWFPFANALFYRKPENVAFDANAESTEYRLDDCRSFFCRQGNWFVKSFDKLYFDRERFKGLLHETDAKLRRYLKTGRYLKEKPEDGWSVPIIEAVIDKDRKRKQEAARPQITIDFSSLDKIRSDAVKTRDSLLTEEQSVLDLQNFKEDYSQTFDLKEDTSANTGTENEVTDSNPAGMSESPLNSLQIQILRTLLDGADISDIMKENHMMASIVADEINGVMFDEIGDAVLLCDENALSLVEDYREELEELFAAHCW